MTLNTDVSDSPLGGETVIYQNWLLKRSQMTRVFKRRFTILCGNGKLFSFRKADLSKPESLTPGNASLSWDIRGCSIEPAFKQGPCTWVVKPSSSSSIQEEIYLRSSSSASCAYWMRVMSALAKGHLSTLFEGTSTLSISTNIVPRPGNRLYFEIEGSLYPIPEPAPKAVVRATLRSQEPGSCITMMEFSADGEYPESTSQPIPRYRFHKMRSALPWTECLCEEISLKTSKGQQVLSGWIKPSVDEGLSYYIRPLMFPVTEESSFDFGLFKFQIRRLIRIIDVFSSAKREISAIFEWDSPFTSLMWLIYISVLLLRFPDLSLPCCIGHIILLSMKQSPGLQIWLQNSVAFIRIKNFMALRRPSGLRDDTCTNPIEPFRTPAKITTSSDYNAQESQGSGRHITFMKEAASHAIQHISGTLMPSRNSSSEAPVKAEVWENQRRLFGGSQFSASNLSVFDRSRWSDDTGKVALDPPGSSDWRIDVSLPNSDDNGWIYSSRWGASEWHAVYSGWDFVRRRRWVPVLNRESPVIPPNAAPQDFQSDTHSADDLEVAQLTSLSSLVTSGSEFGNIHGDYDESNGDHQPKLASIGSIFHEFKSTAARAQSEIGDICEEVEKCISLLSWNDELVTVVAIVGISLIGIATLLVPMNIIVYGALVSFFYSGFRRNRWKRVAFHSATQQHVNPFVSEATSPAQIGGVDAHRLCTALHRSTGVVLTQKVLSTMLSNQELGRWISFQIPSLLQYRKWQKRDLFENFIDHIPPQVSLERQAFLSECLQERKFCDSKGSQERRVSSAPDSSR